jgi:hypothetical protein
MNYIAGGENAFFDSLKIRVMIAINIGRHWLPTIISL